MPICGSGYGSVFFLTLRDCDFIAAVINAHLAPDSIMTSGDKRGLYVAQFEGLGWLHFILECAMSLEREQQTSNVLEDK